MKPSSFLTSECGAVTVDWVVLSAAMVGLGLTATATVRGGVQSTTAEIDRILRGDIIQTSFLAPGIVTDFADSIEGWAFTGNAASAAIEWSGEAGSDGQPGFLRFTDGGRGGAAYLGMSTPYVGDQSELMGGTISFDMQMASFNQSQYDQRGTIADNHANWPILRVTANDGTTMELQDPFSPSADGGWNSFSANVTADAGWQIRDSSGTRLATADEMQTILSDVQTSEIRIEQAYGNQEVIGLDNVRFDPAG
ncbi:MAG: hypothetical protein AAF366_12965 [Pseudomonadota bacterium]